MYPNDKLINVTTKFEEDDINMILINTLLKPLRIYASKSLHDIFSILTKKSFVRERYFINGKIVNYRNATSSNKTNKLNPNKKEEKNVNAIETQK